MTLAFEAFDGFWHHEYHKKNGPSRSIRCSCPLQVPGDQSESTTMGRRQLTQAQKDANKEAREKAARAKRAKAGAAAHRALLAMQPRQASENASAADAGAAANAGAAGAAGAGGAHGTGDADADADGATAAGTTAVGVVDTDGEATAVHYFLSVARGEVRCV